MIVAPDGTVVSNYPKHHLFFADETWAEEGPSFHAFNLSLKSGLSLKVGCGICKDIQPYSQSTPFTDFELASFYEKEKCDLILFSTAWVTKEPTETQQAARKAELHSHWISRLTPLMKGEKKVYFCAANRTGSEGGWKFLGCSCFFKFEPPSEPEVMDSLGIENQDSILHTLNYWNYN